MIDTEAALKLALLGAVVFGTPLVLWRTRQPRPWNGWDTLGLILYTGCVMILTELMGWLD